MTSDLARDLREAFIQFMGAMVGVNSIEAFRQYQTSVSFRNGIDGLVNAALSVMAPDESDSEMLDIDLYMDDDEAPAEKEPLWEAFQRGLSGD